MTPDLDELLEDIKQARQQPGMNAWWQDVLKRAHRAIGDLRVMSAINESGCDRAMDMLEFSAQTCRKLAAEVERLKAERLELDKRIHNQRVALRQNWEIFEMRRNYMGSPASRAAFARLLRRNKELALQIQGPKQHGWPVGTRICDCVTGEPEPQPCRCDLAAPSPS